MHSPRDRTGLLRADVVGLLLLVGFVVIAYLLDALAHPVIEGSFLPAIALALAAIPAAIWLYLFYRRDRSEPEPRRMVLGVYVLAALLAAAVGEPLLDNLFDVRSWIGASLPVQLLGGFLVVGITQAFVSYASIRFSVYESAEFDERTDGIIYGTAAGLGYATVLNAGFIVDSGAVDLGLTTIHVAVIALAYAGMGGIIGFFLSGQKLDRRPAWWSAAGVAAAAAANGLFHAVRGIVVAGDIAIGGILLGPWFGLILGGAFAASVTGLLLWLIRRGIVPPHAAADQP